MIKHRRSTLIFQIGTRGEKEQHFETWGFIRAVSLLPIVWHIFEPSPSRWGWKHERRHISVVPRHSWSREGKAIPSGNITDKFNARLLGSGGGGWFTSPLLSAYCRSGHVQDDYCSSPGRKRLIVVLSGDLPRKKPRALVTLVEGYWICPSLGSAKSFGNLLSYTRDYTGRC